MPVNTPLPRILLAALLGEAVAYGMNTILFGFSVFILITRRERSRGTAILGVATVLMFSLSTVHFALVTFYTFGSLVGNPHSERYPEETRILPVYVPVVLQMVNSLLGDIIVIWRAWILWDKRNCLLVLPAFLIIVSLISGVLSGMATAPSPPAVASRGVLWSTLFTVSAILINVWAVVALGLRYAMYRKDVISALGGLGQRTSCRHIIVLLIESGALYCCVLVAYAGISISGSSVEAIVLQVMAQLTAIYPTLIIVLVCLRLTQRDDMEGLRFAMQPLSSMSGTKKEVTTAQRKTLISLDASVDVGSSTHIADLL